MKNHKHLPTWVSGKWEVAAFRDSLITALRDDRSCTTLSMYFYAVTQSGWEQIRQPVLQWKNSTEKRTVLLFVGTDHGITDPSALRQISEDGVNVRLMIEYHGVFHPKVVWLQGMRKHIVWVGSNNLTRDGLLHNVEFALLIRAPRIPMTLNKWARLVKSASTSLTEDLLKSYEKQRRKFEKQRAVAKSATFTWEEKNEPLKNDAISTSEKGSLIIEVMPKETGGDGKQLQLPIKAASIFFRIEGVGSSKTINFKSKNSSSSRKLTMTVFGNKTVRILINDLEYRDRPCVIIFRRIANKKFEYEIVPQNIFPARYRKLLKLCTEKTRSKSRRWGIVA